MGNKDNRARAEAAAAAVDDPEIDLTTETALERPALAVAPPPLVNGAVDGSDGGAPEPPPRVPTPPRYPYTVAEGKSLTSARGILDAGDEIRETDLSGGREQLEYLVRHGYVVKAKS